MIGGNVRLEARFHRGCGREPRSRETLRRHDPAEKNPGGSQGISAAPRDRKLGKDLPRFEFYRLGSGPWTDERIEVGEDDARRRRAHIQQRPQPSASASVRRAFVWDDEPDR